MKKHKKLIAIIIVFLILALSIFIIIRYNYLYSYSSREKDFKSNIRVADEVRIVSGNTGEYILLSTENIETTIMNFLCFFIGFTSNLV